MNLIDLFNRSLIGRRDKEAIQFETQTFTFGELDIRSNRLANLFHARGINAGDRICIYLENCIEIIDIYLACAKTNIIFVPINILYREREVSHIIADAEPKVVIAQSSIPGGGPLWLLADMNAAAATASDIPFHCTASGDTPAALVYTSGTTGTSKGAILTHNNFIVNGINLLSCWEITESDRFLLSLPLFHVHALGNGLHVWLMSGCHLKLLTRFEHQTAIGHFVDYKPSLFFGVPTMYIRLLEQPDKVLKEIGKSMRLFVCGSAPLPAHIMEAFEVKCGHIILERYGMTETLMNISNPYYGERRAGTVGFPLPGISAKIILPNGAQAAANEEGEVYIKGPNVFAGYWKRTQATIEAFADGYFKTGDMGVVSADGYFTLRGRKSDLIISGGFNIYPREIEDFLLEQPGVADAAVVGVTHATRGEVPVAYIVPTNEYNRSAIEEECKKTFASFKIPRDFITINTLPKTALGKVQKHLLPKPDII